MRHTFLLPIFTAFLALTGPISAAKQSKSPKNAILLSNVQSLTLRADAKTAYRRVPAIPQLKCNGPGCKHYQVDVMRCTNQGSDYSEEDVQWSCHANLPPEFKLGSTEVICEGFDSADDPRVLKGSCGVEYRLLFTDKGEEKYGSNSWFSPGETGYGSKGRDWGSYLFTLIFVGIVILILYSMITAPRAPRGREPRAGGGWGGGWGGGDDPPPPYPGTSPYPGKRYSNWGGNGGQEGWRPGFWSGALGGAAAGYAAGSRGSRQPEVPRSSSWFGSGGRNDRNTGRGSSGSSSSSGSNARYESTGFGSTSRR